MSGISVVYPVGGGGGPALLTLGTGSIYDGATDRLTHVGHTIIGRDIVVSTDWQVSASPSFSTILWQSLAQTSNKYTASIPSSTMSLSTTYYARWRANYADGSTSPWAPTITFATGSYVPAPPAYDTGEPYDSSYLTLSISDTRVTLGSSGGFSGIKWTKDLTGQKVYAEVTTTSIVSGNNVTAIGICNADYNSGSPNEDFPGNGPPGSSWRCNGTIFAATESNPGQNYISGDVIGIRADLVAGTVSYYRNNVNYGGTVNIRTFNAAHRWRLCSWFYETAAGSQVTINTTQTYSTPSGYNWIGDV